MTPVPVYRGWSQGALIFLFHFGLYHAVPGGLEVLPGRERNYSFDPFEENLLHCNFPQAEVHLPGSIRGGESLIAGKGNESG